MPYDNEMYDMLMGDSGDSAQGAKALSDLLRFKKGISAVGQQAMGPAQQAMEMGREGAAEEKNLLGAGVARLHYGQEAQGLKERIAHERQMNLDAISGRRADTDLLREGMRQEGANLRATLAATGKGAAASGKLDADQAKRLSEFTSKINPLTQSSKSTLGRAGEIGRRGFGIMRLVGSGTTAEALDKLNPQWVNEAFTALASIINGGYAPAVSTIRSIAPETLNMSLANFKQWITSKPQAAKAGALMKQLVDVIEREDKGKTATEAQNFMTEVSGYPDVVEHSGKHVKNLAKSLGLGHYLDENAQPKPGVMHALSIGKLPEEQPMMVREKASGGVGHVPWYEYDPKQYDEVDPRTRQ